MTKMQHLIAQREHIRDAIEGHRKRLSDMWNKKQFGFLFDKLNEQYELYQDKYQRICNEICPMPKKKK